MGTGMGVGWSLGVSEGRERGMGAGELGGVDLGMQRHTPSDHCWL